MSFLIRGLSDEVTDCEKCGRRGLKCTVALEHAEHGDVVYYGRDCAATAIYGNKKSAAMKNVEMIARGIEYAKKWLGRTERHTAVLVASAVRVKCPCHAVGDEIHFPNGVVVKSGF